MNAQADILDRASGGGACEIVARHFIAALQRSVVRQWPFRYWLTREMLPPSTAGAICALPFAPPVIGDTAGRRETHNSARVFFTPAVRADHACASAVAGALQAGPAVRAIEGLCGIVLGGSLLRIEHCLDTEGFWLEPHTDISAKLVTILIYLSSDLAAREWGTDIYDADMRLVGSAPGDFNRGVIFVPGSDTWHGYRRRDAQGVRRSLIVNYVKPEWRARHELAFPNQPIS